MKYYDSTEILLGDIVSVPVPGGDNLARVVVLGETLDHLDVDPEFLDWIRKDKVLAATSIIVEWLGVNPYAHSKSGFAPVGNYMFTAIDEFLVFRSRAAA